VNCVHVDETCKIFFEFPLRESVSVPKASGEVGFPNLAAAMFLLRKVESA